MIKAFHTLVVLATLAVAGAAVAQVIVTDPLEHEFAIAPGGLVVIDNAFGNIHVSTHNLAKVVVSADRVIKAVDGNAVGEARQAVQRVVEGNDKLKILRTVQPPGANARWSAQVNYRVLLPRNVNLKIQSQLTGGIRVTDVNGEVSVKNFKGPVLIENPGSGLAVENINGDITVIAPRGIPANAHLLSINGSIGVRLPADARFTWDVDTVMGDARTDLPLRDGRYVSGTQFRGSINDAGNVTLTTQSFKGNVFLLLPGSSGTDAISVRRLAKQFTRPKSEVGASLPPTDNRRGVRLPLVQNSFRYSTTIGDVKIDEIRGAARIYTGAGEINLGSVFGYCDLLSRGGPLTLGEITGPLTARTEGGNISIQRARVGGTIITGGGTIQVQDLGGPGQLSSGGGDIIVRRAAGSINAETRSGDITITLDQKLKREQVTAKTAKGNILLTIPAGFGADVDATIITSDPSANAIRSDVPGLSVQREQIGAKTRIRATGKINGGGDRVELHAQDGGIHLAVDAPRVSPMVPQQ